MRFGVSVGVARDDGPGSRTRRDWRARVRRLEAAGFDVLLTADHFDEGGLPPLTPLLLAAEAAERLRFGTLVCNNDFHHPVLLAREAATLDLLTDGRFELGLGAGHMKSEYDVLGISFDRGGVRVDRLAESLAIIEPLCRAHRLDPRGSGGAVRAAGVQCAHPAGGRHRRPARRRR